MTNDILARRKRELDELRRTRDQIDSGKLGTHVKVLGDTTPRTREWIVTRIAELEAEIEKLGGKSPPGAGTPDGPRRRG